jgi:hypothetical protein
VNNLSDDCFRVAFIVFQNMSYREVRQESPAKRLPVPLPLQHTSPPFVPVTAAGYVDDRIQNTFLEEIYSDIGVRDTFELDLLEFESSNFVPFNPITQLPNEEGGFDETISFADRLLGTSGDGNYLEQQDSFVGFAKKGYGDTELPKDGSRALVKNVTDDELQHEKMKNLKSLAGSVVDIEGSSAALLNKALASPTVTSSSHSSDSKNLQLGSGGPSSMSSTMGSPRVHSTNRCSSREGSEDIMTSPRPPGSAASSDSSSGGDKDITDRVTGQQNGGKSDLSRRVFFPPNNSPSSLPSSPAKVKFEPGTVQRARSVDDFSSSDRSRQVPLASRLESLEESPDKNNERLDQLADLKSPIPLSGLADSMKVGGKGGVMAFRLTPELRALSPSKTPQHLVGPRRIVHPVPPSLSMRVGGSSDGGITQQLGPDFRDRSSLKESVTNLPSSQGGSPPMEQESKRARVIASGSDLLEDVRQSYQYVAGADMFARPSAPSSCAAGPLAPALQTTAGMPRPTVYPPPPQKIPSSQPSLPEGMMTPRYSLGVQGQQGQGYMMPQQQQQQYVADGNEGLQGQMWSRQPPPYTAGGEGLAEPSYGPAQSTPNYRQMYMQKIMTRRNMLETGGGGGGPQANFQQQQQPAMGISTAQFGRENVHPGMKQQQAGYYGNVKPSVPMAPVQMNRPLPLAQTQHQQQQQTASPTFPGPYAGIEGSSAGMMSPRRQAMQAAVGGYRNPAPQQLADEERRSTTFPGQMSTPPRIGDRVASPGLGGGFTGQGRGLDQGQASWRSSSSSYDGSTPQHLGGPQQVLMRREGRPMSPARFFANREMSGGVTSPIVIEDLSYARPSTGSFYEGGGDGGFVPKAAAPRVPSASGGFGSQSSAAGWMDYPRPSSGRSTPGYGSSMGMPPPYPHPRDEFVAGGGAMMPGGPPVGSGGFNNPGDSSYWDPSGINEGMASFPEQPPPFSGRPEGLMQHIMNDRTNVFRSHPFFPLLRDLIIADINFHSASFPFQLISNLPADFGRLLHNYMNRNPAAANYHCSETVERVIMDALRFAHQAIMGK